MWQMHDTHVLMPLNVLHHLIGATLIMAASLERLRTKMHSLRRSLHGQVVQFFKYGGGGQGVQK